MRKKEKKIHPKRRNNPCNKSSYFRILCINTYINLRFRTYRDRRKDTHNLPEFAEE